jgi:hypothetical protein
MNDQSGMLNRSDQFEQLCYKCNPKVIFGNLHVAASLSLAAIETVVVTFECPTKFAKVE